MCGAARYVNRVEALLGKLLEYQDREASVYFGSSGAYFDASWGEYAAKRVLRGFAIPVRKSDYWTRDADPGELAYRQRIMSRVLDF